MSMTQVKTLLDELRLAGMSNLLEKVIEDGKKESWSFTESLDALLQAEADWRDRRRLETRIKSSRLKRESSFEDFDSTAKRSLTKAEVREIYNLKWLEDGRPLVLVGQTGVGKTFLAQATGMRACGSGKTVLFLSLTHWLEQEALARGTGTYLKFREKMIRPDLLILDDFGMRKMNTVEAEDLREILEERSYGKSTLITTQLPPSHWAEVIPDPVLAEAIKDRFEGPGLIFKITGDSYRGVKAKKLAAGNKEQ